MKLLSVDPQNYPDAPREGIRRIMEEVCDKNKHIEKFILILQTILISDLVICSIVKAKTSFWNVVWFCNHKYIIPVILSKI